MRKLIAVAIAALFALLILPLADAVNWTFTDNVHIQGNLTVDGTSPGGEGGTTTLPWDNITSRPTINGVTVTGTVLDNVLNYPAALARLASPTFTGTVTIGTAAITGGTISGVTITGSTMAAKQDAHANLTTISAETNWKVLYKDGSGDVQEMAVGAEGTALCFHGSAAPTACTVGGAPGGSSTQVQFNASGAFAGNSGFIWDNTLKTLAVDNQVTAGSYGSTALDNTRGVTVPNTSAPTGSNLKAGKGWFLTTSNMVQWRNGDNTATLEVFTSGASHTLNFATTGTLTGGIQILSSVTSPTAAQCYGSWNTISGAQTVTLPAVAAGMSTCIATTAAAEITLELDGSDHFVLEGVTMSNGEAIINTTAEAAGDYICVIGIDSSTWRVAGKQGTWTQATP